MNSEEYSFTEKIYDKFTDVTCFIKEKLDNVRIRFKHWRVDPILVFALIFAALLIIIIAAASGGKSEPMGFTAPCQPGYEDRMYTMKEDDITVTMRISDIRHYDGKTGESFSGTVYSGEFDDMMVIADFIFTNSSRKDIVIDNSNNSGLYLGYADSSGKSDIGSYMTGAKLYISDSEKPEFDYSVTVPGKSSLEQRFCFIYPAKFVNMINSLYLCSDYDDNNDDNIYAVMGIGVPWASFKFRNETFFPVLEQGSETAPVTEAAPVQEQPTVRYAWQTFSAGSPALSSYNDSNKNVYSLSLRISLEKGTISAAESGYSAFADNDARVGGMVEITADGQVDGLELHFKVTEEAKKNTLGTYARISDEFNGIRRLNVFMYDEELNMLLPIETTFDEAASEVIAVTDRAGSYCLMDMELWFDSLGISPEDASGQQ